MFQGSVYMTEMTKATWLDALMFTWNMKVWTNTNMEQLGREIFMAVS